MVISLTTTPMMCALLLRSTRGAVGRADRAPPRPRRRSLFDRALGVYERTLGWALRHSLLVMLILLVCVVSNVRVCSG